MSENILGTMFFDSLSEDIQGPMKDFLEKLSGKNKQLWLTTFKRFLRRENPWKIKIHTLEHLWTPFSGKYAFDPNPVSYYFHGVHIKDGFEKWIGDFVKDREPIRIRSPLYTTSFILTESAYDREIELELPEGYVFEDAVKFCAYLSVQLTKQSCVLRDGCMNLFFVNNGAYTITVAAQRNRHDDIWTLDARRHMEYRQSGSMVFSATNSRT